MAFYRVTTILVFNLLLVVCTVEYSPQAVTYVESLILHLAEHDPTTFNCWFLKVTSNPTLETALDALLVSPRLKFISKRLFYTSGDLNATIQHDPSLVVVYCESYKKFYYNLQYFFTVTDFLVSVRILALYDTSVGDEMIYFVNAFHTTQLYCTVHIAVNKLKVSYLLAYKQKFESFEFLPLDQVFIDQTADLGGTRLRISALKYSSRTRGDLSRDSTTEWVVNTIKNANGTYFLNAIDADRTDVGTIQNSLYFVTEDVYYDFCTVRSIPLAGQVRPFYLQSSIPYTMAVAAPKGHRLTALEIFFVPFEVEVWCAVIALLGACCFVMILCPINFENDLILHPLCGFEKESLYNVSRLEKFVLIALTIFFFLLTNAFEAKIIALMTSTPSTPDPRTFDDLIRQNITIQDAATTDNFLGEADSRYAKVFTYDPNDRQFQNRSELRRNFNRKRGFAGVLEELKYTINSPDDYDFEADQSRFVILDRFALGIRIAYHFTGYRNGLVAKLERTHRMFFEAGLLDFWDQRKIRTSFGVVHLNRVAFQQKIVNRRDLGLEELELAWYVLAIGNSLAGFVFAVEFCKKLVQICKEVVRRRKLSREFLK